MVRVVLLNHWRASDAISAAPKTAWFTTSFLDFLGCSPGPIRIERAARSSRAAWAAVAQAYGSSGYRRPATSDVSARTREISAGVSLSSYDRNAAWLSIGRNAVRDSP